MKPIGPKPLIAVVNNKRGEEIIEMFDKKGKIEKWFNPSKNIRAEISRPTQGSYASVISDETNSIYSTKEVEKLGYGYATVRTKKLDLSEYPKLKVAITEKTYINGTTKVNADIKQELIAPNNVDRDSLVDLFIHR